MPTNHIPRPRVACEISVERVVAARAADSAQTLDAAAAHALAAGTLTPSLQTSNIASRDELVHGLRDALGAVGTRSRDITLIVPDATARIFLLDFDTLPDKPQEADAVVRFRLKKLLPFDVEHSALSFDRQGSGTPVRVVAAVMMRSVLEEYESAARDAGYNPGAVLPSTIAALGSVDATRPTMVIKAEPGTATFAIVDQNQLLLYRALESSGTVVTGDSLVDDVNTSLVYFEDRYGLGVDRLLVTGVQSAQALQSALGDSTNIQVEELVSSSAAGTAATGVPRSALAGVVGALVS